MNPIVITILGKNQASTALKAVRGDVDDVGESASRSGGLLGGLKGALGSLGKVAAGIAAGGLLALGGVLASGIADAREANAIMAQTEATIRSTGGAAGMTAQQVADLAGSLSAAAGKSLFGDSDIQGAENILIKFKELKGIVPDITQLSVDMAQALGGAPAQAAETLARAFAKPEDAGGRLAKMGVILTDAQTAQVEAMTKAGDVAGAQAFLMGELNKVYGGQAEAAAKADGGWAQLTDRLGEMQEALGQAVLPLLNALLSVLNEQIMPVVEELANAAVPALSAAWNALLGVVQPVIDAFSEGGLSGAIAELLKQFGDLRTGLVNQVSAALPGVLDWIVGELTRWVPVVASALGEIATQFLAWVPGATIDLIDALGGLLGTMLLWLYDNRGAILTTLGEWGKQFSIWVVTQGLPALGQALLDLAGGVWGLIKDKWDAAFQPGTIGQAIVDGIKQGIDDVWGDLIEYLQQKLRELATIGLIVTPAGGALISQGAIPGRARGGSVSRGRPYIVGDGGRPELFVPGSDGTILPSLDGLGGGGGSSLSIGQIVIQGASDPRETARAVREELIRLGRRNVGLGGVFGGYA